MGKILLFYKYADLEYPKQVQKYLFKICEKLFLKGRIILAHEGINGTVGGTSENINLFIEEIKNNEFADFFSDIDFKESIGNQNNFPKLRIVIRNEIVTLGIDPSIISYKKSGKHLKPFQAHELLNKKPKDLIIFDARNDYESNVGYFENAIKPNIRYFRELPKFIDTNLELFKDKEVLMYCTGGIRCERATAYLKEKNIAKEVYHIEGGIHKYVEEFPNGFFKGKNYVFDSRVAVNVNDSCEIIGNCYICNISCDEYTNCMNSKCNRHFISCQECISNLENTCSQNCLGLIKENKVKLRPAFKKN